jgi:hypothetical protein
VQTDFCCTLVVEGSRSLSATVTAEQLEITNEAFTQADAASDVNKTYVWLMKLRKLGRGMMVSKRLDFCGFLLW